MRVTTCVCGRPLRDPTSIARGLGPICNRRLNGPPPRTTAGARPPTTTEPIPGQDELPLEDA